MPDATPIPDEEIWEGAERLVIGPPVGSDPTGDIRAVEALVDEGSYGRRFSTRWVFTDEEITRLALGDPVYLTFYGRQMAPVLLSLLEAPEVPVEEVPVVEKEIGPGTELGDRQIHSIDGHVRAVCRVAGCGWVSSVHPPGSEAAVDQAFVEHARDAHGQEVRLEEEPTETPHCAGRSDLAHERVPMTRMFPDRGKWVCPLCDETGGDE